MRIKKSSLEIKNIYLLNINTQYNQSDDSEVDADAWFAEYKVDMDFAIRPEDTNEEEVWIYVRIAINCGGAPLPGYSIFVEGTGHFSSPEGLNNPKDKVAFFLNTSALSMVVNYLRSTIMSITALGAFGSYVLPAVDLADLHNQKREVIKNALPRKKRTKRKKTGAEGAN